MSKRSKAPRADYINLTMDSATVYEMVSFFDQGLDTYRWAKEAAVTLTTSLVRLDHLAMAKGPGLAGAESSAYGFLIRAIKGLTPHVKFSEGQSNAGINVNLDATRSWVRSVAPKLSEAYLLLRTDPNFEPWLEQSKRAAWEEHAGRLGGLYNKEFIPEIALILEGLPEAARRVPSAKRFTSHIPSQRELSQLLDKNAEGQLVQSNRQRSDELQQFLEHGYVISAIIRGYLHQLAVSSEADPRQLTRHPFRGGVIQYVTDGVTPVHENTTAFEIGNTQTYFSNILLADALSKHKVEQRITRWLETVKCASQLYDSNDLDLAPADDARHGEAKAIRAAQKIGVVPEAKWLDGLLSAVVLTTTAGISLTPEWLHSVVPGMAPPGLLAHVLSTASNVAINSLNPKPKVAELVNRVGSRKQLRDLARTGPGVVSYSDYRLPTIDPLGRRTP